MDTDSLPSAAQCDDVIGKLDRIWIDLVPRSARPVRKNDYLQVRRVLERLQALVTAEEGASIASGGEAAPSEGEVDDSPIRGAMRFLWGLTPEEWEAVKVLMQLRSLSDDVRLDVFDEIQIAHCMECGQEVDEDEPHTCPSDSDVEDAAVSEISSQPAVDGVNEQRDDSNETK